MKKLVAFLVVCMMLLSTVPALADHVNPNVLPEGSIAKYDQYYEDLNVTRYTPWIRLYHMETPEKYAKGAYGGEGGQVVMSIAASPLNPDYVIMGTDTSGAWLSHDGGENWILLDDNVNTWAVPDVKWHPTKENVVYMVQGNRGGYSVKTYASTVGGLYKSEDAGLSWKQISTLDTVTPGNQAENLINFDQYGNIYYLSSSGLMKSTDDGESWTCLGKLVADTSVDVEEDNTDADEGGSDTDTEADGSGSSVPTATYSFVPGDNADETLVPDVKRAVFSTYVSPDGQTLVVTLYSGMYISRDGGATWVRGGGDTTGINCYSIAVDPTNANHWVAIYAGNKAYTTTDAGYTWQSMNIATYNNGKYYAAYAKFGAPKADGTPTLFVIFGNMNKPFTFALDGTRTDFNAYLAERVTGGDWKRPTFVNSSDRFLYGASGYTCEGFAVCESDPNILYFSFGDILYKSTDGGLTFEKKNSGYSGNYVRQFYFDKNNKLWLAFTDKGLAETSEVYDGENLPTGKMIDYNGTAASVVIDPNNPDHIFTNRGGWSSQTLVESTDGGATWSTVKDADGNSLSCSWSILKYIGDNTIMSTNYKSTDNGATWVRHTDAEGNNYSVLAMSNVDNNILYSTSGLSGSNQYKRSTDGGQTWRTYSISGQITEVYPDEFDANTVWFGTYAGHMVKTTFSTITGNATNRIRNSDNGIPLIGQYDYVSVYAIKQNPKDKNHFVAGGKATHAGLKSYGIIESKDGGTTWYQVKGFKGVMNVQTLEFSPVSTEVFIGTCSNGTLVYDYSKYSPTNNSVIFDMDGLDVEAPATLTGNYGDVVTLPGVEADATFRFNGWTQEYTTYDFYGKPTKVVKEYAPGDSFVVEYTDITLKANYNYVTETVFEVSEDGESFEEMPKLKSGIIKATAPVTTTGSAVPVLGLYDINDPSKVIKFVIGAPVNVDGTQQVEATIDLTGVDTTNTILKYFVWNSLDAAAPLRIVEAIK